MRQNAFLILGFFGLVVILIFINTVAYKQPSIENDNEMSPNRSSYNPGTTGTLAFYSLLSETGHNVTRWRQPMQDLTNPNIRPDIFVIIGETRVNISEEDISRILSWVSDGGRLVVIGREPPSELLKTTADWSLKIDQTFDQEDLGIDNTDRQAVTHDTTVAKPVQPGIYTAFVNSVQPSRFASTIGLQSLSVQPNRPKSEENQLKSPLRSDEPPVGFNLQGGYNMVEQNSNVNSNSSNDYSNDIEQEEFEDQEEYSTSPPPPPPPPIEKPRPISESGDYETPRAIGPIVFIESAKGNLLVEVPFGAGKITMLSDPFIVSNLGLEMADNAILGINLVGGYEGSIAFDEYHQGFGSGQNMVFQYFAGTPVLAIFLQSCLLLFLLFLSQSKRFARPLPEEELDRLSKLEYVSAMAELQQRASADDLALENVFDDFKRRAVRSFGLSIEAKDRENLIKRLAERSGIDSREINDLFYSIEEIVRGEPTNKKEMVALITRLRALEARSGLKRLSDTRVR